MAKQQTETTAAPVRNLVKVSAKQIKLADKPVGYTVEGYYVGMNQSEYVDGEGEISTLHTLIIENELKERTKMLADAGLRQALTDGMIVKGDWFKAVKGEKENIGRGRTMNTWDVFTEFRS